MRCDALLSHPTASTAWWWRWRTTTRTGRAGRDSHGKPVITCIGGGERADSVLAGAAGAARQAWPTTSCVLVHDAARPNLRAARPRRLLDRGQADPIGAILAAPVRDTLKRADRPGHSASPPPSRATGLWRALTPQPFRRDGCTRALQTARAPRPEGHRRGDGDGAPGPASLPGRRPRGQPQGHHARRPARWRSSWASGRASHA